MTIGDPSFVDLWDFRRRVEAIYAAVRGQGTSEQSWLRWRGERDALFRSHPQSPIRPDERDSFEGLPFAPYDPDWNVTGRLHAVPPTSFEADHSSSNATPLVHFADLDIASPRGDVTLGVYWIDVYGGGVFVPFRDATNGETTYGGGRYLLDTAKSADLGGRGQDVVIDFNFAYHPSCVHDARWSCPLAPARNRLAVPIPVGELLSEQR